MRSILTEIKKVFGIEDKPILIRIPEKPKMMRDEIKPIFYQGDQMSFVGFVEITEVKK